MKQIEKTRTITEIKYQAIDGTEFDNRDECIKYDNTALAIMMSRYKPLVIKSISEWELFGAGCDDSTCDIVKLNEDSDVDILMFLIAYSNSHYTDTRLRDIEEKVLTAVGNNDKIIIYRGYNNEDFRLCNTVLGAVNSILDKCEIKIEDEEF